MPLLPASDVTVVQCATGSNARAIQTGATQEERDLLREVVIDGNRVNREVVDMISSKGFMMIAPPAGFQ